MKKKFTSCIVLFVVLLLTTTARSQIINSIAGGGVSVSNGAHANQVCVAPGSIAVDISGNLFFLTNSTVLKVNTSGIITIVAGGGVGPISDGGLATNGSLSAPSGIAIDASGNIFIAEYGANKIRKVNTSGIISTVAGTGVGGFSGDSAAATSAKLWGPSGVEIDGSGNILLIDEVNDRVREINTSGIITTIAGNGMYGYNGDGMAATSAQLNAIDDIAWDGSGNIFIADYGNNRIRKVNTSGIISTVAGTGVAGFSGDGGVATSAQLNSPVGITMDGNGNLYISTAGDGRVRKVSNAGIITTLAGTGVIGFWGDSGPATSAQFNSPQRIRINLVGNLFIVDGGNLRVREINTSGIINTVIGIGNGDGGLATNAILSNPEAIFIDRTGNIYFPDYSRVRKVDPNGIITTIAGTGVRGFSGDGGLATNAQINQPFAVYADASGNVYFDDLFNNRIRKIDPSGIISTFAGNGTSGYKGDGGLATNASIGDVQGITGDATGNIIFTDFYYGVVRKINTSGIISTIAGTGIQGFSGDGGPATSAQLDAPNGISIDAVGNIYVGDDYPNNVVRKINTSGIISTVAGGSTNRGNSGDGGLATAALFGDIEDVCTDAVGNLYIVDGQNSNVRRVNAATGIITTFAGNGTNGFSGDGGAATSAQLHSPWAINADTAGNFYIADINNRRIRKVSINYSLSTTNTSVTQFIDQPFSTNINDNNFHRLLTITPTIGANMLSGNVAFQLSFDPTVQTYAGVPYVQRHYDITPASNAATAQATVKLYFLQPEFDAYNNYVTTNNLGLPFLPSSPADLGGMNNIMVNQFHGIGTAPGNYTGATNNIKPAVSWNASNNWWELTFPVNGFSGFYVSTATSALPLTLLSFNSSLENKNVILHWQTAQEINTSYFIIERSTNGTDFSSIGKIVASGNSSTTKNYSYTDTKPINGTNYYRLKMLDTDGKYIYSKVLVIKIDGKSTLQIFPNPAKNILYIQASGENEKATVQIIDVTGRIIKEEKISLNGNTSFSIDINNLPDGLYNLILKSKSINEQKKFIKE